MIKKLLTLLTAGILAVSMSITAWADEGNSQIPPYTYRIDSTYGSAESKEHLEPYTRKGQILYRVKMNGSYLKNQWVCLYTTYEDHGADSYIYLDEDGYSLDPGEKQDGFTIGPFGSYNPRIYNGENGIRVCQDSASLCFHVNAEGTTNWIDENRHDINCGIIDSGVASIRFDSADSNITPEGHYILITGYTYLPEMNTWIALGKDGEPKRYDFAYDTDFSLDFLGWLQTPDKLANYCKENDIIIQISVIDSLAQGDGSIGLEIHLAYANENSTKKSETPLVASDCCIH